MQDIYNLGDDSDSDEDDDEEIDIVSSVSKTTSWQPQDIEKLKEQTNELLDSKWKETRNRHLLQKMLELDQPTITAKMVDFVLQEGVCVCLMNFITQVHASKSVVVRPGPGDEQTDAMKLAYRAVVLLSPENPSDSLSAFLGKKAAVITKELFEIFSSDSIGSFYHAYRILECLLRCYPAEVYEGLCSDGRLNERINNMLSHIGFSPVCELTIMLVALTPIARSSQLYAISTKNRWMFLEKLSEYNFLLKIVSVIVNPEMNCNTTSPAVKADQHSSVASQLFQELVEKLSLEESGEILLQCLGQNSAVLDALVDAAVGKSTLQNLRSGESDLAGSESRPEEPFRRSCTRLVCFLLRRAAESEIMCFVAHNNGTPPTATFVQNRLYPMREMIVTYVRNRLEDITGALITYDAKHAPSTAIEKVKYSSYEVNHPFTSLRALIVEMMVLLIESDETVAALLSAEMWKLLVSWAIKYPHNNIYHALFYRLIFAVLRQGQEDPQRVLFRKAKFLSFLIDNFLPFSTSYDDFVASQSSSSSSSKSLRNGDDGESYRSLKSEKGTPLYDSYINRLAARGLIMNCANAIRLQVSCQPAASFLLSFISTSKKWQDFLPILTEATEIQMSFGMGIKISTVETGKNQHGGEKSMLNMFISEPKPNDDVVDQDSRFAKSLGFYEDAPWNLNYHANSERIDSKQLEGMLMEERLSYDENEEDNHAQRSTSSISSISNLSDTQSLEDLMSAVVLSDSNSSPTHNNDHNNNSSISSSITAELPPPPQDESPLLSSENSVL